jgi:hypothetical protein
MTRTISEADWRVFRRLHPVALERFCEQILSDVKRLASQGKKTSHERYLAVFKLLNRRNREMADAFDDMRRSTAFLRVACIQSHQLLTEEEMSLFSPETRAAVQAFLELSATEPDLGAGRPRG